MGTFWTNDPTKLQKYLKYLYVIFYYRHIKF